MPGPAKVGRPEFRKTKTRQAIHIEVGDKTRKVLQNPKQAMAAARAKTTRQLRLGGYTGDRLDAETAKQAESLKNGIMGMAVRANFSQEIYDKLNAMDADKLRSMYDNNDLIFEVYFQYQGINREGSAWTVTQGAKDRDALFLIEQYERLYGTL